MADRHMLHDQGTGLIFVWAFIVRCGCGCGRAEGGTRTFRSLKVTSRSGRNMLGVAASW
jgi:hypothetical protein